jgi:glucokinase
MLLSIDVGGTAVKFGMITREGVLISRGEADVSFDGYLTPILNTVLHQAERFLAQQKHAIEGIGISATGQVDDRTGVVIGTNGNIPGYEGTPFKAALEEKFKVPVQVLNDANAAVLGEHFMGEAQGVDDVIMVTLGTGVGGGIICGGALLSGSRGIAGELGHFPIYLNGELCSCGQRGCFERYASTSALVKSAVKKNKSFLSGRAVFDAAESGDALALSLLDEWIKNIASGIIGLIHIFNPSLVLIGGGVSAQKKLLIEPLKKKILAGAMPRFSENLEIKAARHRNDAGLYGAARFWLDREE